uniref:Uncharacterized protein n=1 Tax=Knipowitschia caucasica TaxID=637954 RepID=A0AAV2L8A5_KNICA
MMVYDCGRAESLSAVVGRTAAGLGSCPGCERDITWEHLCAASSNHNCPAMNALTNIHLSGGEAACWESRATRGQGWGLQMQLFHQTVAHCTRL